VVDLLILYDVDGWAYHFRAEALARHAPPDFRVRIASLDLLDGSPGDHAATPHEVEHWEHHHGQRLQPVASAPSLDQILGNMPPNLIFVLCHHQAKRIRPAIRERGWPTRMVVSWNNGWPRRQREFQATLGLADAIIVNNLDYWQRLGCPAGCHPIANGVELDTFRLLRPLDRRSSKGLWCGSEYHRDV